MLIVQSENRAYPGFFILKLGYYNADEVQTGMKSLLLLSIYI